MSHAKRYYQMIPFMENPICAICHKRVDDPGGRGKTSAALPMCKASREDHTPGRNLGRTLAPDE